MAPLALSPGNAASTSQAWVISASPAPVLSRACPAPISIWASTIRMPSAKSFRWISTPATWRCSRSSDFRHSGESRNPAPDKLLIDLALPQPLHSLEGSARPRETQSLLRLLLPEHPDPVPLVAAIGAARERPGVLPGVETLLQDAAVGIPIEAHPSTR